MINRDKLRAALYFTGILQLALLVVAVFGVAFLWALSNYGVVGFFGVLWVTMSIGAGVFAWLIE